ncbi:1-acyl-sn-glycerol-3-phosphate acyltransferase [Kribbella antibiotica]|uniref:1-acyl-sn-glycerol-3-phosphate acyltransferase n=1 Tax=Kribbella antibiotica TaxID=190195 RepID=A0A4V6PEA9_9ACTN|nr:lysophospholipid acyltransferase family protein [Kribbella antibiotica]TDD62907.1 1-acyl-sn-glycerol-3-phosphate acyltransferase [Kribbella antibiotica]
MSAEATPEPAPVAKRQPAWLESRAAGLLRIVIQRGVLKPLMRYLVRVKVDGRPEAAGPMVVVANHSSHLDAPLMVTFLPLALTRRLAVGAAADYFFDSKKRAILTGLVFNAFPIDRGKSDGGKNDGGKNRPMRGTSGRLLDDGFSLLVFPEGTRSRDGLMGDFQAGAAALCVSKGVPCLPIGLTGAYDAMPRGRNWPRPGRPPVRFAIGAPLTPRAGESVPEFAARMQAAVTALHDQGVRNAG